MLGKVLYLERHPKTGELLTASETNEIAEQLGGDLFIVSPYGSLHCAYEVKASLPDQIFYDPLLRRTNTLFEIAHRPGTFANDRLKYKAKSAGVWRGYFIWLLIEEDASAFDRIYEKYDYNVLGDTSLHDDDM